MDGEIATADWETCETCLYRAPDDADPKDLGCQMGEPELEVYMGDWIICTNYKEGNPPTKEEMEAAAEKKRKTELDAAQQIKLRLHQIGCIDETNT